MIIRDVGKFTSVVDEQTPGNDDDTMIINRPHALGIKINLENKDLYCGRCRGQEERKLMIKIIKLGLVATAASLIMGASALTAHAADNVPPAEPKGCHGAATVAYKQYIGNASG